MALAWLLSPPGVTSVIFGSRTEDQLRRNLGAAELVLSEDERGRLDKVSLQRLLYPTGANATGPQPVSAHRN